MPDNKQPEAPKGAPQSDTGAGATGPKDRAGLTKTGPEGQDNLVKKRTGG